MCKTCGCDSKAVKLEGIVVPWARTRVEPIEHALLAENDRLAEENRRRFADGGLLALNVLSAPGSGKTTLLERTVQGLRARHAFYVIEGDQETTRDADRIRAAGCAGAVQVNTGEGCHLDARMIARGLDTLRPPQGSILIIENVGNLVCPSLFDLGEAAKIVVLSVTEGDDKPLKYPNAFAGASLMILNKIDLLPHVSFDVDACLRHARTINPTLACIQVSATRGDGLEAWFAWLEAQAAGSRRAAIDAPPLGARP